MTAMEIIQEVQKQLRLPVSTSLSQPHAQLLLSFINRVQRELMVEQTIWDELKAMDQFQVLYNNPYASVDAGELTPGVSAEIDRILYMQVYDSGLPPLTKYNDDDFREYRRLNTELGQPKIYRIVGKNAFTIDIEVSPSPDKAYTIETEVLRKPKKLGVADAGTTPELNLDAIIIGVKALAEHNQGTLDEIDLAALTGKLSSMGGNDGISSWGDVDFS